LEALTDLVFMQLPEIGEKVRAGERFGEVESVKAVSDLYSPVGGEIVEVNAAAANDLARLTEDPYGFGWLVKIRIDDESSLANLMRHAAYQKQIAEETKEE
jgi:glycine cleavage system H protein